VTDLQSWVAPTCDRFADLLAGAGADTWGAPSLCQKWRVRHVIAHLTMPARLSAEQFGAELAVSLAVIHSLEVTIPLDWPVAAPREAVTVVLDQLLAANGTWFGVDLTDVRLEDIATTRTWGRGRLVRADSGSLVALLCGRTLPDGRSLPRLPHPPADAPALDDRTTASADVS